MVLPPKDDGTKRLMDLIESFKAERDVFKADNDRLKAENDALKASNQSLTAEANRVKAEADEKWRTYADDREQWEEDTKALKTVLRGHEWSRDYQRRLVSTLTTSP